MLLGQLNLPLDSLNLEVLLLLLQFLFIGQLSPVDIAIPPEPLHREQSLVDEFLLLEGAGVLIVAGILLLPLQLLVVVVGLPSRAVFLLGLGHLELRDELVFGQLFGCGDSLLVGFEAGLLLEFGLQVLEQLLRADLDFGELDGFEVDTPSLELWLQVVLDVVA